MADSNHLRNRRDGNYKEMTESCRASSDDLKKAMRDLHRKIVLIPNGALCGWLAIACLSLGIYAFQVKTADQMRFMAIYTLVVVTATTAGLYMAREVRRFGRQEYSQPLLQAMIVASVAENQSSPERRDDTWVSMSAIDTLDNAREDLLNTMRQAATVLGNSCHWQDPSQARYDDFI